MVAALDVYRPDEWHDFFVMVGGSAAVLTGLVFVAMSLNVNVIAEDATHRYRAIGTLTGITATFVICALALMGGQDQQNDGFVQAASSALACSTSLNLRVPRSSSQVMKLGCTSPQSR